MEYLALKEGIKMEEKHVIVEHRELGKLQDSLECGSASKGGCVKVYTDFSDVDGTRDKILKAFEARKFAQSLLTE